MTVAPKKISKVTEVDEELIAWQRAHRFPWTWKECQAKNKNPMRFLFVQPEFENMGIEYVSAVLKQHGHQTELVFIPKPFDNNSFRLGFASENADNEDNLKIKQYIESFQPDVVAFSPFTMQFPWSVKKADYIKKEFPDLFILFGGVHATFIPETAITEQSIDGVIAGEGETAIVEFCKNFSNPEKLIKTPNLSIKHNGKTYQNPLAPLVDMDTLPYPDKELFYQHFPEYHIESTFSYMSSRGCPYSCAFCCNDVYNDMYRGEQPVRAQSAEYVVEQLKYFKEKYKITEVDFLDDVFASTLSRLEELLPLYKKEFGLPFNCAMYPNRFTNQEKVIQILKENCCSWIKVGIQSASESYRREVLKRKEPNSLILDLADLCHKHGLMFTLDCILSMPGDTEEYMAEGIELFSRARPAVVNYSSLIYLPKTSIVETGLELGDITTEDVELINRGLNPVNLASNVERFYGKSGKINYSVFALLLNLATILPHRFIKFILKKKVYKTKRKVPSSMLIFFKILAKFKANQTYLYVAPVKDMFHFGTKKLLNSLSRSLRKTSSGVSSVGNSAGGKFRPGTF